MPPLTVRVPATSANLGSGYDAFGLALALYDTFALEPRGSGGIEVRVHGQGSGDAEMARENLVAVALRAAYHAAGEPEPDVVVSCENAIPIGRGLGSSAAAVVGGLLLADARMGGRFTRNELFRMAADIEGHADNVAAALVGGFTVSWRQPAWEFERVEPGGGLAAVFVVGDSAQRTSDARALIPHDVAHADAAFNVGRAGLLALGIALGRADLLGPGMADRLHQPYRFAVEPHAAATCEALVAAGADAAALSGSGPSVIGLVGGADDAAALKRAHGVAARLGTALPLTASHEVLVCGVDRTGSAIIG